MFHPQARSLILADRQHWKCWGVQLQPGGCPAVATEVVGGNPCPTPLHLPKGASVPSGCSALSSPVPPWPSCPWRAYKPQNLCRTWGVLSGGCPDLTHPGMESHDQGCQRNGGQGFLFLSSFRRNHTLPMVGVPLGAPIPIPPSSLWHFNPLKFGLVPFDVAFWKLPQAKGQGRGRAEGDCVKPP